jgi:polyphosphate kinase
LLIAPFQLHATLLRLIEREATNARAGLPARIIAKMNALVDQEIIEALYRASQAGVTIDLIIRGICCLRPGVRGLSDHIRVISIVDRFLEHSRISYFENGCQPEIFIGSADWMPRNFYRRIEVVFPIEDGTLRERITSEFLALPLADNVKARLLQPNGTYNPASLKKNSLARRSQGEFIKLALGKPVSKSKVRQPKYPVVRLARSPLKNKT